MLSKRLEICTGPLSELELYLLTDSSLKITLQTPAFRLHLHKDMKIFKRISYPDTRNGSHSDDLVWTFNEFRDNFATKEMKNKLESDVDFRVIQLKKKLAEAKVKGKATFEEHERPAKASGPPGDSERHSKIKEQLKKWKEKPSGDQSPLSLLSSCLHNGATQSLNTDADVRSRNEHETSPANHQEDLINTDQKALPTRVNGSNREENFNSSQDKEVELETENPAQDLEEQEEDEDSASCEDMDIVNSVKRTLQVSQPVSVSKEMKSKPDSRLSSSSHSSLFYQSSGSRPLKLCSRVSDQRFSDEMMTFLSSHGVTSSTGIQTVMWPALARLSSLVAVAGPGSGKTLGWALPLLAALADQRQYRFRPSQQEPDYRLLFSDRLPPATHPWRLSSVPAWRRRRGFTPS